MLRQVSNTHTSLGYFHGIQKDQNRSWKPEDTAKPARTRHCWTTSSRPGGREVHFGPKVFSLLLLFILSDFFFFEMFCFISYAGLEITMFAR